MASVFSYDPNPPRVSSPWSRQAAAATTYSQNQHGITGTAHNLSTAVDGLDATDGANNTLAAQMAVTHLEAEPQDGPTEYKLHLLLRPRRFFPASTARKHHTPGSQHGRLSEHAVSHYPSAAVQSSSTSRQHRLEQLTTQLLWRLQQSSPYHSSSATNVILPSLPDATEELRPPPRPAKPPPGLEESNGALYEIGVADDGTFVGLTQDEMEESLNNLGAMAASLGCSVQVLRMVNIGEQQWLEHAGDADQDAAKPLTVKLFVAEAYIKPELQSHETAQIQEDSPPRKVSGTANEQHGTIVDNSSVEQIRISLTGATTCGKSSLLGTLSTSTLDNGRGKSRLSLLKHRHEIASGVTSSVVQELIGYRHDAPNQQQLSVVNYAAGNISSWTDIHASSVTGRLAFISDSAGHPRYRRTTIRSLMSWAPHWTLLCIAANSGTVQQDDLAGGHGHNHSSSSSEQQQLAIASFLGATAHLSMAHLDICLRLHLPLIIIVTKFDVATKSSFRQILSTILTVLKSAGKQPVMLPSDGGISSDIELQEISPSDLGEAEKLAASLASNSRRIVPILFTSAVNGTGIRKLHAMLRCLPITSISGETSSSHDDVPRPLFHVDDVFTFSPSKTVDVVENAGTAASSTPGSVISGYLAQGEISIGDELVLGPFSQSAVNEQQHQQQQHQQDEGSEANVARSGDGPEDAFLMPRSYSDAIIKATSSPKVRAVPLEREWRRVKIVSVRNLRLPVRKLESDQVGTLGIIPMDGGFAERRQLPIRKGMVLAGRGASVPAAAHTFTAAFDIAEAGAVVVGSFVVVYCASVRASAKVVAIALEKQHARGRSSGEKKQNESDDDDDDDINNNNNDDDDDDDDEGPFGFQMDEDLSSSNEKREVDADELTLDQSASHEGKQPEAILVTFQLVTYREWLEIGSQVLIITGGGPGLQSGSERGVKGLGGLEGLVGTVIEKFG